MSPQRLTTPRVRAGAAALLLALPWAAHAQDPAATPPFRPDAIQPYSTYWKFSVTRPDGVRIVQGLWSDLVDTMHLDGRAVVRRIQGVVYVNGLTQSTVNVFDAATLRPVSSIWTGAKSSTRTTRTFTGDAMITRHVALDGTPVDSSRIPLQGPVYDYSGGTYGLLLAALPLRPGLDVSFRSIAEFADSVETIHVHVVGRDSAYAGGGRMKPAWKVQEGGLTYWIQDAPPYVLRLEFRRPNGMLTTWEIPG